MSTKNQKRSWLDTLEWLGNKLPDPTTLFLIGTIFVMLLSAVAVMGDWQVKQKLPQPVWLESVNENGEVVKTPVLDANGKQKVEWKYVYVKKKQLVMVHSLDSDGQKIMDPISGLPVMNVKLDDKGQPMYEDVETDAVVTERPKSLFSRDGFFWAISSMVQNFMRFPPLGVVLVGMLGIGIAERTRLIAALLKAFMLVVPGWLLTPAMVFVGIMSSLGIDAGYVVLPPLAAALYKAVGRSPLVGLAAVFAGVSAGFNANLLITGLDPTLAGFSNTGAQVLHAGYQVNPAANWYFMIVSTIIITLAGWATTSWFVEKRLNKKSAEDGGPTKMNSADLADQKLKSEEITGLKYAGITLFLTQLVFFALILIPGGALNGKGTIFDRWVEAIVPMLFISFLLPAIVYGVTLKQIRSDKDAARLIMDSIAAMAPIIVLAFFAAQFIEYFKYSGLDRMLAMAGGQFLGQIQMSSGILITIFILMTMFFNLFIGSMSAKYALFAPIFIPMFMMVGISPELTQAAYRIGDSVTNIVTPLNPYLIIVLMYLQKIVPKGGMGTLISLMLPYSIVFGIVWLILILVWMALGIPLGVDGALWYDITANN